MELGESLEKVTLREKKSNNYVSDLLISSSGLECVVYICFFWGEDVSNDYFISFAFCSFSICGPISERILKNH